jgi:transposase-like protein
MHRRWRIDSAGTGRGPGFGGWRVDETYLNVKGDWVYLYHAADKGGDTVDVYLSPTRNTKAAWSLWASAC